MSSGIQVQRICQYCGNEFTARTTVTRYCSHKCASAANKQKIKFDKVERSNKETQNLKAKSINDIKAKEFLTVRDAAILLNCSIRTAYRLIEEGNIKAVNIAKRKTLIKRVEIDRLFEQPQAVIPQAESIPEPKQYDISECYSTEQVRANYNISESGLRNLIIKYNIPKFRKGWFAYIPKAIIDKLLINLKTQIPNGNES